MIVCCWSIRLDRFRVTFPVAAGRLRLLSMISRYFVSQP